MAAAPRPNILILMADQMTADVVQSRHPCHMPNARRLASQGVRFTHAACVTPHCCPSRASFFTGHLPSRHGVWNNIHGRTALSRGLSPGIITFGEQLEEAGYALSFAKWHVSATQSPADCGWRMLPVPPSVEPAGLLEQDPLGALPRQGWDEAGRIFHTEPRGAGEHSRSAAIVEAGVAAIHRAAHVGGPWCLYLGIDSPHDPYRAPEEDLSLYDPRSMSLPPSFADGLHDKPRIVQRQRRQLWDGLGEAGARECLRHYWAACSLVDRLLGRLLDALEKTGQADNTMVVFTSDHGDYAGAHGLWCKGVAAFREAYAIAAIVRWPAGISKPGRDCNALVSIADFTPTFLELAGVEPADDLFGRSLLPWLSDSGNVEWRDALVGQLQGVELYYTQRSIWTHDWKYVFNGFDFDELYDLRHDPHEMDNLADPARWRGEGATTGPYPPLPPRLDEVRRDLIERLWRLSAAHDDRYLRNGYWTVGLVPYGPKVVEES